MAVVNDPKNSFDFAYRGFQYPLPPSWKRAIRLEDQIQWLLQAILKLNWEGVSEEDINNTLADFKRVFSAGFDLKIADMQKKLDSISAGAFLIRSPFDGSLVYAYIVNKQLHDLQAKNACTYKQIADENYTYKDIKDMCETYKGLTYSALENLAIVKPDFYVTPADKIPVLVTGYKAYPHIGHSVAEIPQGFIIPGYDFHLN